jgi:1-phosphofructokinase/tagatose 6-phosphate kinase
MIVTFTPNTAIDKTLTVPNFQVGFRHRASESLTMPGGKGVNIARTLKTLGLPVVVSGLVGGRAGQQIVEGLARENLLNDFVHIAGESRTSTAVIDTTSMSQTEIIEYGPIVSEQELAAFHDKIDYLAKGAQYVVLAGSLPRRVPKDFYAQVLERLRHSRCFTVLDSSGEPLRLGVRARPKLVSPNLREAEDLVGYEFHDEQDIIDGAAIIAEMGAQNVIITMQDGCVAHIRQGRRHRVYRGRIPVLKDIVSTVGSGDAFLAGFIACRFQKMDVDECLRYGLACGAANTQLYGAGVLDRDEVERLHATTEVVEVEPAAAG